MSQSIEQHIEHCNIVREIIQRASTYSLQRYARKEVERLIQTSSLRLSMISKILGLDDHLVHFKEGEFIFENVDCLPLKEALASKFSRPFFEEKAQPLYIKLNRVCIPPDDIENVRVNVREEREEVVCFPKIDLTYEVLESLGVDLGSILRLEGENLTTMKRKSSYNLIVVPLLRKIVIVCEQKGERTFVAHNTDEPEYYFGLRKSELKALTEDGLISEFIWLDDFDMWKLKLKHFLTLKDGSLSYEQLQREVLAECVKCEDEYSRLKKERNFHWPAHPEERYAGEWKNWYAFLKKEEPVARFPYDQLTAEVAKRPEIKTYDDYLDYIDLHRQECRGWPKKLHRYPEWKGARVFFGKAKLVNDIDSWRGEIAKNGIKTFEQYQEFREQNKRFDLPGDPMDKWHTTWKALTERPKHLSLEELKKEVAEYANQYDITSCVKYRALAKEFKKETWPIWPEQKYENWPGWKEFLKF